MHRQLLDACFRRVAPQEEEEEEEEEESLFKEAVKPEAVEHTHTHNLSHIDNGAVQYSKGPVAPGFKRGITTHNSGTITLCVTRE